MPARSKRESTNADTLLIFFDTLIPEKSRCTVLAINVGECYRPFPVTGQIDDSSHFRLHCTGIPFPRQPQERNIL